MLDEQDGGSFRIGPADGAPGIQRYIDNTNVLETVFTTPEGSFRVLDFAPRFVQFERTFRPTKLVRIVEPLSGTPRVRIVCDPRLGWSKEKPKRDTGSHHISYHGFSSELRLTTDVPLSYVEGIPFALTEKKHLVLAWGSPVEEPLAQLCDRFLVETTRYWQTWVKHCDIPPMFQQQVIRSALALKLHCFEDTGAIVAAITTSIPEAPGSGRNWDYRYCWLRDAYYVLDAFRLLGHFEEREQFISYLLNIAAGTPDLDLAPLYRVDGRNDLEEEILTNWPGYEGDQPVRIGNGAATHHQHDIFGEMVLALAPVFMDDRFKAEQTKSTLDLLFKLAQKAIKVAGTPDAGIWEVRKAWEPQTFSTVMCWAAADRVAKVAARHAPERHDEFRAAADKIRAEILDRAYDPELQSLVAQYGSKDLDASLLQAVTLRFLPPSDPAMRGTIDAVVKDLGQERWLLRYRQDDGLGQTTAAFVICTFWLIEALAVVGRVDEAREALHRAIEQLGPLGLMSEDWETSSMRMYGNFPQAYSHVGLIHAAFAASPKWDDVL
ncbi:MAG: glycoside hydrolase 15-related protein [Myxococcaceae bacterium]|nr:glycoside hydrolase 15-related protein [Myxococcaceae bacterium]